MACAVMQRHKKRAPARDCLLRTRSAAVPVFSPALLSRPVALPWLSAFPWRCRQRGHDIQPTNASSVLENVGKNKALAHTSGCSVDIIDGRLCTVKRDNLAKVATVQAYCCRLRQKSRREKEAKKAPSEDGAENLTAACGTERRSPPQRYRGGCRDGRHRHKRFRRGTAHPRPSRSA